MLCLSCEPEPPPQPKPRVEVAKSKAPEPEPEPEPKPKPKPEPRDPREPPLDPEPRAEPEPSPPEEAPFKIPPSITAKPGEPVEPAVVVNPTECFHAGVTDLPALSDDGKVILAPKYAATTQPSALAVQWLRVDGGKPEKTFTVYDRKDVDELMKGGEDACPGILKRLQERAEAFGIEVGKRKWTLLGALRVEYPDQEYQAVTPPDYSDEGFVTAEVRSKKIIMKTRGVKVHEKHPLPAGAMPFLFMVYGDPLSRAGLFMTAACSESQGHCDPDFVGVAMRLQSETFAAIKAHPCEDFTPLMANDFTPTPWGPGPDYR